MSTDTILITGATGKVGSLLVKDLTEAKASVKALVRTEEKGESLRAQGIEPVIGDFDKPETLLPALAGSKRVFLLSAPDERMVERESNFIEAARRAGVAQLVKLSAFGVSEDAQFSLGQWHYQIEQQVKQSGIPFTILRPNGFMQNMFGNARTIREQGVFYAPLGEAKVSIIDARDIARVASIALTNEGHEGRIYELTGPEALSYQEVAEKFSAVLGKEVRYIDVPMEAARQGMLDAGMQAWLADAIVELLEHYITGGAARVTETVKEVTGSEPTSFEQFVRDYGSAFA